MEMTKSMKKIIVIAIIALVITFLGPESTVKPAGYVLIASIIVFISLLVIPWVMKIFGDKDASSGSKKNEQRPKDTDLIRNKNERVAVLVAWVILLLLIPTFGVEWYVSNFFTETPNFISYICWTIGFALGVGGLIISINRWFLIKNPTTGMFMTIDPLQSLIGGNRVNVSYGPGNHICFPWEKRYEGNNISLEEATNEFKFKVQCIDGTLEGTGVFWARPDMNNALDFLTGVASFTEDMEGLIISEIASLFSKEKVMEAINNLSALNAKLDNKFVRSESAGEVTEVEKRFGIHLGNVVIKQLLPSDELQRTISAKAEAEAIKDGTLSMVGAKSWTQVQRWLKAGTITQADISLARDRFLSVSGNLEGMEIKRNEIDFSVHGLDKDVAEAISAALNTPAAAALAAKAMKTASKGGKK